MCGGIPLDVKPFVLRVVIFCRITFISHYTHIEFLSCQFQSYDSCEWFVWIQNFSCVCVCMCYFGGVVWG